jgi:hypothetical protein
MALFLDLLWLEPFLNTGKPPNESSLCALHMVISRKLRQDQAKLFAYFWYDHQRCDAT